MTHSFSMLEDFMGYHANSAGLRLMKTIMKYGLEIDVWPEHFTSYESTPTVGRVYRYNLSSYLSYANMSGNKINRQRNLQTAAKNHPAATLVFKMWAETYSGKFWEQFPPAAKKIATPGAQLISSPGPQPYCTQTKPSVKRPRLFL